MLPAVGEVLQQSFARDAEDIAIVGQGTIDGQALPFGIARDVIARKPYHLRYRKAYAAKN